MDIFDALIREGYDSLRRLPTGDIAGVRRMNFTYGLFVGLDAAGYRQRYCYETRHDAVEALRVWDGSGDPPLNWIKAKPSDRLGPGATK